ncbi:nickel pincer cofactor biosynthesis protein LarC [Aerosakkonema funiforme]|uniref:Putative nickel insertion protein n=2 Tax=Oscillatoriophycideae TaxID=1301283 RepID=A0A926VDB5_9CYAN|nr:nickel pincer cofactor biosynthesis protein LarC [Aerosakkonema funiforme]MBD2181706.1 nickel pincer cofactor biosynthesis protein LarC [Aerosakkonema funiforme FACHB-1375]
MNKLAYLECPAGIAGDMCLGALVDVGVPLDYIKEKLHLLGISHEYELRAELVQRNGQQATKVHVDLTDDHHHHHSNGHSHHRHLPEIEALILAAKLPVRAQAASLAIFRKLAEAEGAVHGIAPDKVHFHEVGATDAIVDIVGTCLGLDWLGIDQIYCSAMPTGGGTVTVAHGQLPVPTPAVLKLWESRQVPVYSNGIDKELCTPTGVAIAVTLASSFGPAPEMILHRVGLGAGSRQLPIPNILRLWIGEEILAEGLRDRGVEGRGSISPELETISVLETQIDDLSPQAIAYTFDALFASGALDVFSQPIIMKKSRQGVLLTVICHPENQQACEAILFRETTTLGIRRSTQMRAILQREIQRVITPYGEVRVKVAGSSGSITNVQPEYEDCAALAKQNNVSWREVHRLALQAWYSR